MLQARKTTINVSPDEANIIGHMCYAARKLWNVCNYERRHYKELGLEKYPDWYYQKKAHKNDLWYKNLPAQSAQEVCKLLSGAWKSFFRLKKTGGIENPKPPRFKQENIPVTYMQKGIVHEYGSPSVRLSLPRQLMAYMLEKYDIDATYLFIENNLFCDIEKIKQIKLYPPEDGKCKVIAIYEVPDVPLMQDNGRYLAIDPGINNLLTCLDSAAGETLIVGRKYLSLCHYFYKEIARVQSQWAKCQSSKGIQYPKSSKHILRLYEKKNDAINDYLHKVTRAIVNYCLEHDIHTVVIGDVKGIRKGKHYEAETNQKLHAWPFAKIYLLLSYKLANEGITFIKQKEAYSSQCSPFAPKITKRYAKKSNRKHRGLYTDQGLSWNADCVGAYNILRLYLKTIGKSVDLTPLEIQVPTVLKVAV